MADDKKPETGEDAEAKPKVDETESTTDQAEPKAGDPKAEASEDAEAEAPAGGKAQEPEPKEPEAEATESRAAEPEAKASPTAEEPAAGALPPADGEHDGHGGHDPTEVESDRPPTGPIVLSILLSVAAIVAVVVGVNEIFRSVVGNELNEKVYDYPSAALRQLRAEETQKLGRYQYASKKDGVVRIPLDRAIAITLQDYSRREPPPAPAPTADSVAAPAGSASAATSAAPEVRDHK